MIVAVATACVVAVVTVGLALAQDEIPVTLRARTFQYNRTTKILTAAGDVVVIYQDVTIHADHLRADLNTNEVRAEGHVAIEVGRYNAQGAALSYNLTSHRGRIEQAAAEYTSPMILGAVHLRAEVVQGTLGGSTEARTAFCTTCEAPNPVAYLTAREFAVYPNDKIVGRRVSVWISGRRILTWPYFVIFLREQRASRLLPVVGYSQAEGFFLKTFYSYTINQNNYGYLRLDLLEKLGIGYGVEHTYRFGSGNGTLFLYQLHDSQIGGVDTRIALNHQQRLGDLSMRLYTDYLSETSPLFPSTNLYSALDLYYHGTASSTDLYQIYSRADFVGFSSLAYSGRLIHIQQLSSALSAEVVADVSQTSSVFGTNDQLAPRLFMTYRGAGYTASLIAEGLVNLDGNASTAGLGLGLQRLPELSVALNPRVLPGTHLSYQLTADLGRFRETQFIGTADAFRADVAGTIRGWMLESARGNLGLGALVRASYYSTGDARVFLAGQATYTRFLSDDWQGQVGITYQDQGGRTPFFFDHLFARLAQANATLTYRRPNLIGSIQTGFDAVAGRVSPITVGAQFLPRPDWAIAAAVSYDPSFGSLTRAEVAFDVKLSPLWQVSYYGYYDGFSRSAVTDHLTVTRVWQDCLATAFTYRGITQEIWLEAWLTALPWAHGRVGVGNQGNILFDQPWLGPQP